MGTSKRSFRNHSPSQKFQAVVLNANFINVDNKIIQQDTFFLSRNLGVIKRTVGKSVLNILTFFFLTLQAFVLKKENCCFTSLKPLVIWCKNIRENLIQDRCSPQGDVLVFVLYFHWKSRRFLHTNILFHGAASQIERLNLAQYKGFFNKVGCTVFCLQKIDASSDMSKIANSYFSKAAGISTSPII